MAGTPPFFPPNTPLPVAPTVPLPFDNGITENPDIQSFPDNGPFRPPPVPGPAPIGLYEYISIPRQPPVPPTASYYEAFTAFQQVESQFAMMGIYAERIDLWNEVRVYRIPIQYIWKFQTDANGPFINAVSCNYRVVPADPTQGISTIDDWLPVL